MAYNTNKFERANPFRVNESSENTNPHKMVEMDKQLSRMVAYILIEIGYDSEQDVQTYSAKGTGSKGGYSHKPVGDKIALERRSKKKVNVYVTDAVINLDDLSTNGDLITNHIKLGVVERLEKIKSNGVAVEDSLTNTPMNKERDVKGKESVRPAKSWRKVIVPSRKRKQFLPVNMR